MAPTLILLMVFIAVAAIILIIDKARAASKILEYTDKIPDKPSKWITETGAEFIKHIQDPKNIKHIAYRQLLLTSGATVDWTNLYSLNAVQHKEGIKIRNYGVVFKPNQMETKIIMAVVEKIRKIKIAERDTILT